MGVRVGRPCVVSWLPYVDLAVPGPIAPCQAFVGPGGGGMGSWRGGGGGLKPTCAPDGKPAETIAVTIATIRKKGVFIVSFVCEEEAPAKSAVDLPS